MWGHFIDRNGIHQFPAKVQAFPQPTSCRHLLGLINFYHCFIPGCAKCRTRGKWALIMGWHHTFSAVKEALASAGPLKATCCDWHDRCLQHCFGRSTVPIHQQWQPTSCFSKKLQPAKRYIWSRTVYVVIEHFRYFLEGRTFHAVTDHKPLTFTFQACPDCHTPRQCCFLDYMSSQFTTDLHYAQGVDNSFADALSQIKANVLTFHLLSTSKFWLKLKGRTLNSKHYWPTQKRPPSKSLQLYSVLAS